MTIQKIRSGRVNNVVAEDFVGVAGTIFYNQDLGDLRLSDGKTVGGTALLLYPGQSGIPGGQGIQGNIGLTGIQGNIGATGLTGIQGNIGATGLTGIQGNIGLTGESSGVMSWSSRSW
jgi:hypothetical protein